MTEKRRMKTYVKGLDEALGGGIPEKKVVLIKGSTGTMKSSLAYYILYENALKGKKSLFITFEQDRDGLEQQMLSLGLDGRKVSSNLQVFDLSKGRERIEEVAEKLRKLGKLQSDEVLGEHGKDIVASVLQQKILDLKVKLDLELVVIDSLDALEMLLNPERERATMFEFFERMRSFGLTCFVVSESSLVPHEGHQLQTQYEDFLVDGIIELRMEPINGVDIQRRIRCVKMRGTRHSSDYYTFFCGNGEFEIAKSIT